MISLDCETTGVDLVHGCQPFFVSTFSDDPKRKDPYECWEWDVDPFTREPQVPSKDKQRIEAYVQGDELVLHNAKFDVRALEKIGSNIAAWSNIHDTAIMAHCLTSAEKMGLKELALKYLDIDDNDQKELQVATNKARVRGRKLKWRIAAPLDPHFPAQKRAPHGAGFWVMDTWMPRAVAKHYNYPEDHPWWTVLRRYAELDAYRTMGLWMVFKEALEDQGLWGHYEKRRKILEITYKMETKGVTLSKSRLEERTRIFSGKMRASRNLCKKYASGKIQNIDSGKQLQKLLFNDWKLKPVRETKTGYSVDKKTMASLLTTTNRETDAYKFITSLNNSSKYTTALDYLDSYKLYSLVVNREFLRIHPNFNSTGTATTRLSSYNPNQQNISKQNATNLRYVFGPGPGRVWFAHDYENIEMRISAYSSGEKELIKLFEKGGSYHLLISKLLYPKEYEACEREGVSFKERYEDTYYQWVKNGNFANQYGAQDETADNAYNYPGAKKKISSRFKKIAAQNQYWINFANKHGYVETLGGYRLQTPLDQRYHKVKPTLPYNYFVQGSAGWAMICAMLRVDDYLSKKPDHHIIMTIHDELVFDFPIRKDNKRTALEVKRLMELSSKDIGLPTPVDPSWVPDNWSKKYKLDEMKVSA